MANILLGVTGSVAALKTPELVALLTAAGHAVQVVATNAATYFFDPATIPHLTRDADEWPGFTAGRRWQRGEPVRHIELRRWAEVFVIAPLDANTLAKFAVGLCDNCLTCVWRAWEPTRRTVLAPAMNTLMWDHPLTRRHLRQLAEDAGLTVAGASAEEIIAGVNAAGGALRIVPPVSKLLACGDVGVGAMAALAAIVAAVGSSEPEA